MKIAICVPVREMVHSGFAFDLVEMVAYHVATTGNEIGIFSCPGTLICDQRTKIAQEAIKAGVDWLLWLDSDMRFPITTLRRLLAHNKSIVGANYVTKSIPALPVAFIREGVDKWIRVPTTKESTGLERVSATGFGVLLTSADTYKKMEQPWFHLVYSTTSNEFQGEDIFFCLKAAASGKQIYIDHDLSKEVSHLGSIEFQHRHTERWLQVGPVRNRH